MKDEDQHIARRLATSSRSTREIAAEFGVGRYRVAFICRRVMQRCWSELAAQGRVMSEFCDESPKDT